MWPENGTVLIRARAYRIKESTQQKLAEIEKIVLTSSDLPPPEDWKLHFPVPVANFARVSLFNENTASKIANAFLPSGSKDKVVVEAYPGELYELEGFCLFSDLAAGPGALTRALLKLPKSRLSKLIVIEDYEPYLKYLRASSFPVVTRMSFLTAKCSLLSRLIRASKF